MREAPNWSVLPYDMKDALEMVVVKISRILHGDCNHIDHWADIQGYARLIENRLKGICI